MLLITVLLLAGADRRAPPPETADTLPQGNAVAEEGNAVAEAIHEIDELFSDSGEARVTTLLFRGEALTPDALSQMDGCSIAS